jgi:hypothetical protein
MKDSERAAYWSEINQFWMRVFGALQRFLAFVIFSGIHYISRKLLFWSTPEGWARPYQLAEGVTWCIFVALYAYLGWDMLTVFMPRLRGKEWK